MVSYGSAQTSTSGILVEDVLHLATEDGAHENLLKTTSHLGSDWFISGHCCSHGLFGLGMEKISAPSVLSREGLIADSFSICFGHGGIGSDSIQCEPDPPKL
uniref:Xylanase inhibitor N-terminal domain-containing protein n=1 Tax=Populus trichocarpa TaxID=3694 RepID=A0A3N7G8Y7_POPTR